MYFEKKFTELVKEEMKDIDAEIDTEHTDSNEYEIFFNIFNNENGLKILSSHLDNKKEVLEDSFFLFPAGINQEYEDCLEELELALNVGFDITPEETSWRWFVIGLFFSELNEVSKNSIRELWIKHCIQYYKANDNKNEIEKEFYGKLEKIILDNIA